MTKNETKVHELLEIIMKVEYTRGGASRLIQYAQTYAQAAMRDKMVGKMLRVQVLYTLNNLTGWRGEQARKVKAQLNKLVKKL